LEFNVPFQHKYGYIRDEDMPESEDTNFSASGHHLRQHLNTGCTISSTAVPEITAVSRRTPPRYKQSRSTGPSVTLHMMRRLRLPQTTNSN